MLKEARQADKQTDSRGESSGFNEEIAIFTICFGFSNSTFVFYLYICYIYLYLIRRPSITYSFFEYIYLNGNWFFPLLPFLCGFHRLRANEHAPRHLVLWIELFEMCV